MYPFMGAVVAAAVIAPLAQGAIVNEFVPTWRGQSNAVFAGWESFMSGYGGFNAADVTGSFCGCSLFNFGAGSVIDADGDIRSGAQGLDLKLVGGQFSLQPLRAVVVNVAIWDGELSASQMQLRLTSPNGTGRVVVPSFLEERDEQSFDDGSVYRSYAFTFEVSGGYLSDGTVGQWRIDMNSPSDVALDAVAIDLDFSIVPSPGAMALGLLGVAVARFRRR